MTIKAVYSDEVHDEQRLLVDRDYLNNTVTVTVDNFGAEQSITLPFDQYLKLSRMIGVG